MKRFLSILLMFAAITLPAAAEQLPASARGLLPETVVIQSVQQDGENKLYALRIPETGEELILNCTNESMVLKTSRDADCGDNAQPVDRAHAEKLIQQFYPGCRILFARDETAGKLLGVAGDNFCGSIVVSDECIRSRNLEAGEIFRDGMLTSQGAAKVLALHRPEAEFRELELDMDDGLYEYEGEAMLHGEEFEFELNAATGKLLEWERD